ncbi:type II secretion system protein (twitching motility protein) [Oleiphilus messinensis]|uniref:Type II secretion system protein (Twitching motility protein) n=1 Tax=Oleiphilus messinensis TaxID=141451 RepID=A0A1Y0I4D4_9GAMM|nr:PilT/PilU family type 4a pilus ATPase [Oleiphilus messinensis]ARU55100.1 type II secretion system protein (twitching motility protein) [Oleiphilus messinensis]
MSSTLHFFLQQCVARGASDLFLSAGARPSIRLEGRYTPLSAPVVSEKHLLNLIQRILSTEQLQTYQRNRALDIAYTLPDQSRFRINLSYQRGAPFLVARHIKHQIPEPGQLGLPEGVAELSLHENGLILFCGNTGSGKSTSLAAMVEHRNTHVPGHILAIEDPIEFWFEHKLCMVNQREIGADAHSCADALRHAVRESPDMLMVGEIRDFETARQVVSFSETGHLCLSSLHATSSAQAIQRLINYYPESARSSLLMDLALNLKAVVCQRLVPGINGRRVLATEVLMNTPLVAERIQSGRLDDIAEAIDRTQDSGAETMDQSLFRLFKAARISAETAVKYADSKVNMSLLIRFGPQATRKRQQDGRYSDVGATGNLSVRSANAMACADRALKLVR